ncbi:MAG TPA: hypothetical protein PK402_00250 [Tepidisphaeraceae bacterium]|nr:hypothetical protein [Tepidisphaeraceae bacterium]
MLLQTNSYIVPKDKRTEHARLVKRFKQIMSRYGCDDFEVYEMAGPNWSTEVGGRFIQIMKFRDKDHQKQIQEAEQNDSSAQELVREFMEMINFAYQRNAGHATTAFYISLVSGPGVGRLAGDARVPGVDPNRDADGDAPKKKSSSNGAVGGAAGEPHIEVEENEDVT